MVTSACRTSFISSRRGRDDADTTVEFSANSFVIIMNGTMAMSNQNCVATSKLPPLRAVPRKTIALLREAFQQAL